MIIYKTTNLVNNKIYIGQTRVLRKINGNYLGSGVALKKAIKKYGRENFIREILETCDSKEQLNEREMYWIDFYRKQLPNRMFYNIAIGGSFGNTLEFNPNKKDITDRISKTLKENNSKLTKKQRSELYGSKLEKNPRWKDGRCSKVYKCNVCKKIIGRGSSFCVKCCKLGDKNPFANKKHSKETLQKISNTNKGKKPANCLKIQIDDIIFESQNDAAKAFKVTPMTITYRIKSNSEKYKNYKYYEC